MNYALDYVCDDGDPIQSLLNRLYNYADDYGLKINHRNRLNKFYSIMNFLYKHGSTNQSKRALDIGCNAGFFSYIISQFGFGETIGVDVDIKKIQLAKEHFQFSDIAPNTVFKCVDINEYNDEVGYDLILSTEVIEHTDNPIKTIEKIVALLKKHGLLIISLPNICSLSMILRALKYFLSNNRDKITEQHFHFPFYRSLSLFKNYNLQLILLTGSNLLMISPIVKRLYGKKCFYDINRFDNYVSSISPFNLCSESLLLVYKKQ